VTRGAGAVRQATNKAALLEPADQADPSAERRLSASFISSKDGRCGRGQPLIDEHQQLVLFFVA
jgi:hypothetical protein